MNQKIDSLLEELYGSGRAGSVAKELEALLEERREQLGAPVNRGKGDLPLDEQDAFLICYGDSFHRRGQPPLQGLRDFSDRKLSGILSGIHILPFFPYTSDDGFSVSDYYAVNPEYGDWHDISVLAESFKLMSDLVLNHCSASCSWFQDYLQGKEGYGDFFVSASPEDDLSGVVRPRTHPLLTPFKAHDGTRYVWTTFSEDQVDLNFADPRVLLEMVRVLLFHIEKGIQVIRLDAIAYLWKELGHSCIHHPKTHAAVKLFRAILDIAAPWVVLITETNVPHQDNISYFGDGGDEAHMVYQFPLPPLVLDSFLEEDCTVLREWARGLTGFSAKTTFFNFLASHDGVGLMPARGLLSPERVDRLVESCRNRGGRISDKASPEGPIPYEMNISYLDAVAEAELPDSVRARKFLASQSIMLMLRGVPGIYFHSLVGSGNWQEGLEETGRNRTINREKLSIDPLLDELNEPGSLRNRIYAGFRNMLEARRLSSAFHPAGRMEILSLDKEVFGLVRVNPEQSERVLCMVNISPESASATVPIIAFEGELCESFTELISGDRVIPERSADNLVFQLLPYGVYWLRPEL